MNEAFPPPGLSPKCLPYSVLNYLFHPSCLSEASGHLGLQCHLQGARPDFSQSLWFQLLKDFLSQYLILYIWSYLAPRSPLAPRQWLWFWWKS